MLYYKRFSLELYIRDGVITFNLKRLISAPECVLVVLVVVLVALGVAFLVVIVASHPLPSSL